jgi:hypothetical protein
MNTKQYLRSTFQNLGYLAASAASSALFRLGSFACSQSPRILLSSHIACQNRRCFNNRSLQEPVNNRCRGICTYT